MKIRQVTSKLQEFHLSLLGKDISSGQSSRDLGVILDPNLTFDNHITTRVLECIARLAQNKQVKHWLHKSTLLTVIHASVFNKMYYCSNVWANITNKKVKKLQAVQNFACRIVSGAKKIWSCNTPLRKACLGCLLRTNFTIAKVWWPSNAWPVTPLNILLPSLLPVSKLANEQRGVTKS